MREIGILIIDFSFPEEETSRAQHLSLALSGPRLMNVYQFFQKKDQIQTTF